MTNEAIRAKLIVQGIVKDLSDRRGLRHEWDQIDDEIKDEILTAWQDIVITVLNGGSK